MRLRPQGHSSTSKPQTRFISLPKYSARPYQVVGEAELAACRKDGTQFST